MSRTWAEQLHEKLIEAYGKKKGASLSEKYLPSFPLSYSDEYSNAIALNDIEQIEQLASTRPLNVIFYQSPDDAQFPLHVRLYQWQHTIPLADILPIFENFGLRAYDEVPHKLVFSDQQFVWISDFSVTHHQPITHLEKVTPLFQDAFLNIFLGNGENDGFNKLTLNASLSWREIIILRTYAKYLRQVGFRFTQPYIEKALSKNANIAQLLISLFVTLHQPNKTGKNISQATPIEQSILSALQSVTSLDEDLILRRILDLIKATLRTNYFQSKDYLSIKLHSKKIPELPLPKPLYEIFVYATRFEGIHLRNSKVARGGIRWSDRREDFRTEILGLMKAQVVKNAVIVPSGAKGGFVLKALPAGASRELIKAEVIYCYSTFIRGLLDLTDNIVEKKIIPPQDVVCYDDPDTYLVVAADKGTATFSDLANSISKDYHFWLGDAFASGGSNGYDHKKMGITARGAWESIKRHFRELNTNVMTTTISVIGIGDMSGDVFGNGLLYSNKVKLLAAFDHRDIFIDPDPDPEASYAERFRLFNLPTSSWADYNSNLISKGGGVFNRNLKSITLTPAMKKLLDTKENSLTPNELIRALLKAPVDLIFNGGIGTYVKASTESHNDVGDRANEYCRINGGEMRCKVVGEGGNLGFTQLGRVEYALTGGLINTDFIDNSAGVDCSDHEVNLKILLDDEVQKGKLTEKKRDETLASLTQEVAQLVLHDNYSQALVMSFSAFHAVKNINLHHNYIKELESIGILDRRVEFLPDDKTIIERKAVGLGLTRPELAILLAYTKIYIKSEIIHSNLMNDPHLMQIIATAFPISVRKKYHQAIIEHRLHENITATQLSNQIVNTMGFTFVYRVQSETGASVDEIIRAQLVSASIFGATELGNLINGLDFKIPMAEQYEMLFSIRNLINLSTRWFLNNKYLNQNLSELIDHFTTRIKILEEIIPELMGGYTRNYLDSLKQKFHAAGLPIELAQRIAAYRAMYTALNIIDISTTHQLDLVKTAKVYFTSGERINLVWFRDRIAADSRDGHWNIMARLTLRDELDFCQRAFAVAVMQSSDHEPNPAHLVEKWIQKNPRALRRWEALMAMIHGSTNVDYTMFFIALRELQSLITQS